MFTYLSGVAPEYCLMEGEYIQIDFLNSLFSPLDGCFDTYFDLSALKSGFWHRADVEM